MASFTHPLKRFLNNHSRSVDFLSASCIICLCLIILLPQVHESFQAHPEPTDEAINTISQNHLESIELQPNLPQLIANVTGEPPAGLELGQLNPKPQDNNNNNHHHHNHKFPTGEVIICAGFFVFYCIGLGLWRVEPKESQQLMVAERRVSTNCCSSTRCPSGQREILEANETLESGKSRSHEEMLESAHLFNDRTQDNDCLLLLNRHHNHHTHSHHHDHHQQPALVAKKADYGSTSRNGITNTANGDLVRARSLESQRPTTVYVEEIRITSTSLDSHWDNFKWPLSTRVAIFGLILAASLILFDMNVHGLMKAIKVFRAAATGALLYVAFFLVLPRGPAGCNSCKKEEV